MLWIVSTKIQEFPLVHYHKCWTVPKQFSPLSPQSVIQRRNWDSMRCPMYFQCLWVIVGNCCDRQQHVGRCSVSEQSLDNLTAPSPC